MHNDADTYDYIVTGAGSAGCVVAARLSENGRHRVLLLEAGGKDRSVWIKVPMGYSKLYANAHYNWMYETEPEAELQGRALFQPRGKVLGGTSSINGMLYMRGHPADYDDWQRRGCTGWDWHSVLPYFKKSEDQERGPNAFHGIGGPLRVSNHPFRLKLAEHWIAAAIEAGLPANDDFNDGVQDGAGPFQSTTSQRRRWSAADAYLHPARKRPNLTDRHQRARHAHPDRESRRRRRCLRCRWRCAQRPRAQRGDRLRRRVQFAAIAAAVGARAGPAAATARHPRDPRHAGRRRRSAGPFLLSAFNSAARSRSR